MAVIVILDLYVKPEAVDELIDRFKADLPDTRAFEGNLEVDTCRDQEDPSHISLIERWETRADQEKYIAWRVESGNMEKTASFITQPIKVTYFDELEDV
jgi:heme oxygenase (mycobilin-producing)